MSKNYLYLLYKAGYNTVDHEGVEHAGYMAFMNILALFPFVVFIISMAGFIGETNFGINFVKMLVETLPGDFINALKPRINEIISGPPHGLLTLSIFGAIWTSSTTIEGLRTILNRIYHVKTPPAYILRRLLSIAQFLALNVIIIFTMFILLLLPIIYEKLLLLFGANSAALSSNYAFLSFIDPVWEYARDAILFITLFIIVSAAYFVLPNAKLSFKSVVPGAIIAVILWVLTGTVLSSFIVGYKQVSVIYGSLGGIIIAMFFFYIINIIFIYGAELNFLLSKKHI